MDDMRELHYQSSEKLTGAMCIAHTLYLNIMAGAYYTWRYREHIHIWSEALRIDRKNYSERAFENSLLELRRRPRLYLFSRSKDI